VGANESSRIQQYAAGMYFRLHKGDVRVTVHSRLSQSGPIHVLSSDS
jgi:hypothetical protein